MKIFTNGVFDIKITHLTSALQIFDRSLVNRTAATQVPSPKNSTAVNFKKKYLLCSSQKRKVLQYKYSQMVCLTLRSLSSPLLYKYLIEGGQSLVNRIAATQIPSPQKIATVNFNAFDNLYIPWFQVICKFKTSVYSRRRAIKIHCT